MAERAVIRVDSRSFVVFVCELGQEGTGAVFGMVSRRLNRADEHRAEGVFFELVNG